MTAFRAFSVASLMALTCSAVAAQSAGQVLITDVSQDAICRNAQGAKISPPLRPSVPVRAQVGDDARAQMSVAAVDCFLNPSEYTVASSKTAETCSSARVAASQSKLMGTRGVAAPRCSE